MVEQGKEFEHIGRGTRTSDIFTGPLKPNTVNVFNYIQFEDRTLFMEQLRFTSMFWDISMHKTSKELQLPIDNPQVKIQTIEKLAIIFGSILDSDFESKANTNTQDARVQTLVDLYQLTLTHVNNNLELKHVVLTYFRMSNFFDNSTPDDIDQSRQDVERRAEQYRSEL